jgi:Tfp pilus assembly protein PilN
MRAVNLLPREEPKRRNKRITAGVQLAIVAPFLVVSLLAAGYLLASSKVNDNRATLKALQEALASIPPRVTAPPANAQLALQRDQRIAALGAALQSRIAWDRVLRQISSVLPEDVWLTTLTASSPQAPAAAPPPPTTTTDTAPTDTAPAETLGGSTTTTPAPATPPPAPPTAPLTISGFTYSQEGVARFLSRLAVIPELETVKLLQSVQATVSGQVVVQFSIEAGVRPAAT